MVMPTRPMFQLWSGAPRCAWPRHGRSIVLCARPTESGSARSKRSDPCPARSQPEPNVRKLPPQPVNGNGGPKLRDQLCLLIRQHRLDASRVKQYAAEFCGTQDIRDASREQIQSFITHLAETAGKDRDGLLCKLNSYGTEARGRCGMKRRFQGLASTAQANAEVPDGVFLVRVDQVRYARERQKPFYDCPVLRARARAFGRTHLLWPALLHSPRPCGSSAGFCAISATTRSCSAGMRWKKKASSDSAGWSSSPTP